MIECMRTEATRKTVTEQRWIPVKYHELTEEERKECLFSADIKYMIDCKLPDDEQEIIVTDGRHVWVDTCIVNDGYALDSGHDWIEDVIAWMPLPEPFRESEEELRFNGGCKNECTRDCRCDRRVPCKRKGPCYCND